MRSITSLLRWATNKMKQPPSWASPILALAFVFVAVAWVDVRSEPMPELRLNGFNVIATPADPFGSAPADLALAQAKKLGASAVAVIPFLWQPSPSSPDLVRGADMNDAELRAAIREAHTHGLAVLVKPHVWVPTAGPARSTCSRRPTASDGSRITTASFCISRRSPRRRRPRRSRSAPSFADHAAAGMERSDRRPAPSISGRLLYVAHNVEEAETVPFWDRLDTIGVTLYPPLGADDDRDGAGSTMRAAADRLDALAACEPENRS